MRKEILNRFAFVCGVAVLTAVFAIPAQYFGPFSEDLDKFKITLGLDLAGGTELDYKIDLSEAIAQNTNDDPEDDVSLDQIAESVRDALEKRVNPAGVGEILVKRSQINNEEHVLIQMPPSSNVETAKRDAEKDNKLEFFEEDPALENIARIEIAKELTILTPDNFQEEGLKLAEDPKISFDEVEPQFKDQFANSELADKLFALREGAVMQEIVEDRILPVLVPDENGQLNFAGLPFPRDVLGIVKVTSKERVDREKVTPPEAEARHILFAYPGAMRAGEDVKYASKEVAQAEATKLLEQLKTEGTDNFETLAREFSTEGAAQQSGGNLGSFKPGTMAQAFNDAVFNAEGPGLLPELIETDFGFHIIEILSKTEEIKTTTQETKLGYQIIGWKKNDLRWKKTKLGGSQLDAAAPAYDQIGQPIVSLRFSPEGGDMFGELTGHVAARTCDGGPCRLGIKVGGQWITTPTVSQKIVSRDAQITGNFTYETARELADDLNLGAIDAPVILSGQTTIKAELGAKQLEKSLKAAGFGLIATILFMVFFYRLAGVIASVSLLIYIGIFVSLLKLWPESFGGPIVLTLAGAAGIALSVGLAVDGNILIFERMKEELRRGRKLSQSLDLGFERAWSAIRDSNLTTLLTCLILFFMGAAMIKGFAITLIVGTLLSMFTAVTISRNLLRFVLLFDFAQNPKLFGVDSAEIGKKPVGAKIRTRKSTK